MENGFSEEVRAILYSLWFQLAKCQRTSEGSGSKFAEKHYKTLLDVCTELGVPAEGSSSEKDACTALNMFLNKMMKSSKKTDARQGSKGRPGEWRGAILNHEEVVDTCEAAAKSWALKKLRIEKI